METAKAFETYSFGWYCPHCKTFNVEMDSLDEITLSDNNPYTCENCKKQVILEM